MPAIWELFFMAIQEGNQSYLRVLIAKSIPMLLGARSGTALAGQMGKHNTWCFLVCCSCCWLQASFTKKCCHSCQSLVVLTLFEEKV